MKLYRAEATSSVRTSPSVWEPHWQCENVTSDVRTLPAVWEPHQHDNLASRERTSPADWESHQLCENLTSREPHPHENLTTVRTSLAWEPHQQCENLTSRLRPFPAIEFVLLMPISSKSCTDERLWQTRSVHWERLNMLPVRWHKKPDV